MEHLVINTLHNLCPHYMLPRNDLIFTIVSSLILENTQRLATYRYECKSCKGYYNFMNYMTQIYFLWKCYICTKENVMMGIINNSHFIWTYCILNPFPVCMYSPKLFLPIYRYVTIDCPHISVYYYNYYYFVTVFHWKSTWPLLTYDTTPVTQALWVFHL